MKPIQYTAALALLCTLSTLAIAQPPTESRRGDRVRTFLVLRIAEELNLPDDKALQLSGIIRKSEEQRDELRRKRQAVGEKLRGATAGNPSDTAGVTKLIDEANDLDQQIALVPEQAFREAQKILTVQQQARLVLFRPELQNQIRQAIRRRVERQGNRPRRWREPEE